MAKSLSSIVTDKLLLFNFADVNEMWARKHLNVHVILTKNWTIQTVLLGHCKDCSQPRA